jgi:hypothetical protein
MTKKALRASLVFLFLFLLLFSVIPGIAQADIGANGGKTTLKSDIELMSGIPVHGGGHFTWVISGAAANELRIKIIEFFDGYVDGIPNGRLEYAEVDAYRIELERYLEDNEHEYMGANLRRFALLNREIRDDIKGLIDTSASSTGNIEIRFYFDAWMPSGEEEILLTDTTIPDAVYYPVNETFVGTYKIEHMEYMVSVGDFSAPEISSGTFYLIRTPFGDIFHYSNEFSANDNPNEKLKYEPFSWIECPLVLFIVIAVFGYFTVTMPGRFRKYDVVKIVKVHTLAKVLLLVLVLLYLFAGIGGIFIGGVYIWVISVVFLFVSLVISKTIYEQAARVTRMPEKPEVEAQEETQAEEEVEAEPEEGIKNVQCATCGEIYDISDKSNIQNAPCPACGSIGAVEFGREEPPPPPPPEDMPPLTPPPEAVEPKEVEEQ